MIKCAQVGVQFKMGKMEIMLRGVHPPPAEEPLPDLGKLPTDAHGSGASSRGSCSMSATPPGDDEFKLWWSSFYLPSSESVCVVVIIISQGGRVGLPNHLLGRRSVPMLSKREPGSISTTSARLACADLRASCGPAAAVALCSRFLGARAATSKHGYP